MRLALCSLLPATALALLCNCGSNSNGTIPDSGPIADGPVSDGPAVDGGLIPADLSADAEVNSCPRDPAPADRRRWVVVAHPFGGPGEKSSSFEVLELSGAGNLSKTGTTFDLDAEATDGQIAFTPDGEVGLVALGNGTIGAFRLDTEGAVTVVHGGFSAGAWVSRLVMGPRGERVYALSSQWRKDGGGIHSIRIGCDGTLTDEGLIASSKLPYAMTWVGSQQPTQVLVVARDILTSTPGDDVFLVDLLGATQQVIAGVDAFGDDEAITNWAQLTADGRFLLVADNAGYSDIGGDRVAVVEVAGTTLRAAQVLQDIGDPVSIATSPYNNAALVLGAQADEITVLDYDPQNATTPFSIRGPLDASSNTLIPADAVMITRGALNGRVLITENTSIRQVQFEPSGAVTEKEIFSFGSGIPSIPGAIGVQP